MSRECMNIPQMTDKPQFVDHMAYKIANTDQEVDSEDEELDMQVEGSELRIIDPR